jgi:choline dehydrogenase
LEVRTGARAAQILFDGTRATGVRYANDRDRSVRREVFARNEVIVVSGTVNTAKLLQISGADPAWLLNDLGVKVLADLSVGENFRDHYSARIAARVKNVRTINEMSRGLGLIGQIARWATGKPSILAVSPWIAHWFWKTEDTMRQPDIQGVFSPASYKQGFVGLPDDYPGMTCGMWQHRPESINRSLCLSDAGDNPAALIAIGEAVAIYRRLAAANPARFEAALDRSRAVEARLRGPS